MPSLRTLEVGDILVVSFNDPRILDTLQVDRIGKELLETPTKARAGKLLLDMSGVLFMSSAMISEILRLENLCGKKDIKLKLCCISAQVLEAFKLMRLQKILKIYATSDKAVAAFKKKGWFG